MGARILDIRGTHGSGKSWLVHKLLQSYAHMDWVESGRPIGYIIPKIDCGVVGRYERTCGGCDGVGSADEIVRRVRLMARIRKFVVLEGILVSHTYKRYAALAQELGDYRFLFLDTPLKICIQRVKDRRIKVGNTKPLNTSNIVKDWEGVWERVRGKCMVDGLTVVELNHEDPYPQLLSQLR